MSESRIKDELDDVLNKAMKFLYEESFVINLKEPDEYYHLYEEFYSFNKKYNTVSWEIDDFLKFLKCKNDLGVDVKTDICILRIFNILKSSYVEFKDYYKSNSFDMAIYGESLGKNYFKIEDVLGLDSQNETIIQNDLYPRFRNLFKGSYTKYINSQNLIRDQESIINFMNCNLEISKLKNSCAKFLKESEDGYIKFVEKYLVAEHEVGCLSFIRGEYADFENKINSLNQWIDNFNSYIYGILKTNGLNYSKYFNTDKEEVENLYSQLIQRLKKLEYKEYLQTTHWRNFREQAILFYQKCKLCNTQEKLCVHHSCYENKGKETFNDVVVLCESCHLKFHSCENKSNIEINVIDE